MSGGEEAADFTEYLQLCDLEIPYLADILAYEQAQIRSINLRQSVQVECESDPLVIIECLAAGEIPQDLDAGGYRLQVALNWLSFLASADYD